MSFLWLSLGKHWFDPWTAIQWCVLNSCHVGIILDWILNCLLFICFLFICLIFHSIFPFVYFLWYCIPLTFIVQLVCYSNLTFWKRPFHRLECWGCHDRAALGSKSEGVALLKRNQILMIFGCFGEGGSMEMVWRNNKQAVVDELIWGCGVVCFWLSWDFLGNLWCCGLMTPGSPRQRTTWSSARW